jgi:fatty-acyl-CoA synthase
VRWSGVARAAATPADHQHAPFKVQVGPLEGERPLTTVAVEEGATTDFEALRTFLADQAGIAKWQLPERWTVIESIPKTSVGKFDKKVLRRRYAQGDLDVTQLG